MNAKAYFKHTHTTGPLDIDLGQPHTLNGYYVDGISLPHGSTPHIKHMCTFAVASDEVGSYSSRSCEYISTANHNIPNPPTSIRNDYFCATGSHQRVQRNAFYVNQKLWDGKGCGCVNTCCAMNHRVGSSRISISPALMRSR